MGMNEKIADKIEEAKIKIDSLTSTVTNKAFDMNLLKAIQKDFGTIIDLINQNIKSEIYIFNVLEYICDYHEIEIEDHIKKHFRIE